MKVLHFSYAKALFMRCEAGALSIWFALSLVILVGSLAFAVDYSRLQVAKSNAQTITVTAVRMVGANAAAMTDVELQEFAQNYVSLQITNFSETSSIHVTMQSVIVEKEFTEEGLVFSVGVAAKLSYLLLPLIGLEDVFVVNSKASATLAPTASDVVILTDTQNMALSTLYLDSIHYLIDQFENQSGLGNILRLGTALSISSEVNIAPRVNWVDETWPEDILPPFVDGIVSWTGPLEEQHWCVVPRNGVARSDFTPPQTALFQTSLEIDQNITSDGNIIYTLRANPLCPSVPIQPLSMSWSDHRLAAGMPLDEPAFILERGLLWAGRVLDDDWAAAWPTQAQIAEPHQKKILLFLGSAAVGMINSVPEYMSVCDLLKAQQMQLFVVDISNVSENKDLLSNCGALAGYLSVQSAADFKIAVADFAASLLHFKLTAVD